MTKQIRENGSYTLTAGKGFELVVNADGEEQARAKSVEIPAAGTLNEWTEVQENQADLEPVERTKEQKIERLKAELAALESEA